MSTNPAPCHIGFLIFPEMTQIDFTEPYEVFARLPDTSVHVVARTADPVRSDRGLVVVPSVTCEECPPLDVLVVPGGPGTRVHRRSRARRCRTAVGYRASTYWLSLPLLDLYGATAVRERVVIDRNRVTAGGCTAGIDFAFRVAAMLRGDRIAQQIQLQLEYSPTPPFNSGSPASAPREIVDTVRRVAEPLQQERWKAASQWRTAWLAKHDPVMSGG